MGARPFCCEVCDRSRDCGLDCGSCDAPALPLHERRLSQRNGDIVDESGLKVALIGDGQQDLARLFEAAPDMLRALLDMEWESDGSTTWCHSCNRLRSVGHKDSCALNEALKKAGVR